MALASVRDTAPSVATIRLVGAPGPARRARPVRTARRLGRPLRRGSSAGASFASTCTASTAGRRSESRTTSASTSPTSAAKRATRSRPTCGGCCSSCFISGLIAGRDVASRCAQPRTADARLLAASSQRRWSAPRSSPCAAAARRARPPRVLRPRRRHPQGARGDRVRQPIGQATSARSSTRSWSAWLGW